MTSASGGPLRRVARLLVRFAAFLYDFVVGDDWRVAVAVVVVLAGTWALARAGVATWWVLPPVVLAALVYSVRRQVPGRAEAPADPGPEPQDGGVLP